MKYLAISSVNVLVDGLFEAVGHEAEDPPDLGAGGRQKPHQLILRQGAGRRRWHSVHRLPYLVMILSQQISLSPSSPNVERHPLKNLLPYHILLELVFEWLSVKNIILNCRLGNKGIYSKQATGGMAEIVNWIVFNCIHNTHYESSKLNCLK